MAAFEIGCPYWVYAPDGTHCISFNQPNDGNFAGYLTDVTGLDDGDIRENANLIPAGHGGRSHKYFVGRRPWTITGIIMPTTPAAARAASTDRIEGLMHQCLGADGQIQWLPSDGILRYANFRKQLSTRNNKGQGQVDRRFIIAGVIDSPVILSGNGYDVTSYGTSPSIDAINIGTGDALPHFQMGSPFNHPVITNTTTGQVFEIDITLGSGYVLDVDMSAKYPTLSILSTPNSNYNGSVNLTNSHWEIAVSPQRYTGANHFTLTDLGSITSSSYLRMMWHDSWV